MKRLYGIFLVAVFVGFILTFARAKAQDAGSVPADAPAGTPIGAAALAPSPAVSPSSMADALRAPDPADPATVTDANTQTSRRGGNAAYASSTATASPVIRIYNPERRVYEYRYRNRYVPTSRRRAGSGRMQMAAVSMKGDPGVNNVITFNGMPVASAPASTMAPVVVASRLPVLYDWLPVVLGIALLALAAVLIANALRHRRPIAELDLAKQTETFASKIERGGRFRHRGTDGSYTELDVPCSDYVLTPPERMRVIERVVTPRCYDEPELVCAGPLSGRRVGRGGGDISIIVANNNGGGNAIGDGLLRRGSADTVEIPDGKGGRVTIHRGESREDETTPTETVRERPRDKTTERRKVEITEEERPEGRDSFLDETKKESRPEVDTTRAPKGQKWSEGMWVEGPDGKPQWRRFPKGKSRADTEWVKTPDGKYELRDLPKTEEKTETIEPAKTEEVVEGEIK